MRTTITCVVVVALSFAVALPRVAAAQGQASSLPGAPASPIQISTAEQLEARASQSPRDLANLLELARLYFAQHRFDDASRTLTRAMAVVQQEKQRTSSTSAFGLERTEPLRVGGDVKEPKKIKDVAPIYPADAMAANVSGYVIIEAIIGQDGTVTDTKVIRSHPLLDQAAVDAVRQWRYTPSLMNGVPVSVIMSVTVIFSLK